MTVQHELQQTFEAAAAAGVGKCAGVCTGRVLFGFSLGELLKSIADKAIELGREYRTDIELAARSVVDKLVAKDIPGIPDAIEAAIDASAKELAYQAIGSMLDAMFGEAS